MVERSEQIVLDYVLSSNQGEVVQRNGQDTNRLKVGDKTYIYNRDSNWRTGWNGNSRMLNRQRVIKSLS